MLVVKLLGDFQISDGEHVITDEMFRSDMLKKLTMYMMTHREHPIAVQELSEALWREGEIDNPIGALKNLMYRFRTILKQNLGEEKYIITTKGAYAWNSKIEVEFDAEWFEEYCKKARISKDTGESIENYEKALLLYRGDFMGKDLDHRWAVTLSAYYHSMFLNAVKSVTGLYMDVGRYKDVENLCLHALEVDPVDEEIHCCYIRALIKENKLDMALKGYDEAVKILYDALGIRNSAKLQQVQSELLQMSKGADAEMLENIHEDMDEDIESEGVYFCGYPVFREIYRLEVRKNSRLGEAEYLVLFTVELKEEVKTANEKMARFLINQGLEDLKKTLSKVLRIGDVAARYSDSQFLVMLPTCTYESSRLVAGRVQRKFDQINKGKKVSIRMEYEQISDVHSSFVR